MVWYWRLSATLEAQSSGIGGAASRLYPDRAQGSATVLSNVICMHVFLFCYLFCVFAIGLQWLVTILKCIVTSARNIITPPL